MSTSDRVGYNCETANAGYRTPFQKAPVSLDRGMNENVQGHLNDYPMPIWIYPHGRIALHGTLVLTRLRKTLVGRSNACSNMRENLSLLFVGCNAVPGVGRKSQRGVSIDGRLGLIALVTVTS